MIIYILCHRVVIYVCHFTIILYYVTSCIITLSNLSLLNFEGDGNETLEHTRLLVSTTDLATNEGFSYFINTID